MSNTNARRGWLVALLLVGLVVYLKVTAPPVDCKALANSPGFDKATLELFMSSGCNPHLLPAEQ